MNNDLTISNIMIIFLISTILWLIYWYPTYLILKPNYKYYKHTYNLIKNKDYLVYSNCNQVIIFKNKDYLDTEEIIYFKDSKGIKLINGYIYNSFMTWFDPYSNYWYRKIKEQLIINSSVENIRDYKLKQLIK